MKKTNKGVTLVEIAIVLVIIGLLLGGILKGQELINNAKVRAIADRQNSLKVAWYAFIDRYQGLPGDYVDAKRYIPGAVGGDGDGTIAENESPRVFQHLAGAGYLRCPQCTSQTTHIASASNSLQNNYGGIMSIWSDGTHYAARGGANATERLQIHTGPRIPSNILAEVDRKLDDGIANGGDFVFNQYDPTKGVNGLISDGVEECTTADDVPNKDGTLDELKELYWRNAQSTPPVYQNCGGSVAI